MQRAIVFVSSYLTSDIFEVPPCARCQTACMYLCLQHPIPLTCPASIRYYESVAPRAFCVMISAS
eukprot:8920768-Alexandrium_andersonii.AAC.1